jgi:hypothetical protein
MFDRAIVRNAKKGNWAVYENCQDVLVASEHGSVLSVLKTVEERASSEGLYAVGYVAYELTRKKPDKSGLKLKGSTKVRQY